MSVSTSRPSPSAEWPGRDRRSPNGYVYVIEFSTGAVKVGRTRNPQQRATKLMFEAAQFGASLTRWWLSKPHTEFVTSEERLIAAGSRVGTRIGSETFRCNFHDMVAVAEDVGGRFMPAPRFESQAVLRTKGRQERARELRAEGFSYRKIAAELGVSLGTVHNDLAQP